MATPAHPPASGARGSIKKEGLYHAHTAEDEHGKPLPPESGKWQPLADHLRQVAAGPTCRSRR